MPSFPKNQVFAICTHLKKNVIHVLKFVVLMQT